MAIECFVITLIFVIAIFSFAHADRIRWVVATTPLCILPLSNSISSFICTTFLQCELPQSAALIIILVSATASCVWIGIASTFLRTNRMKIPYIGAGVLFNIVLGIILINHYIHIGS